MNRFAARDAIDKAEVGARQQPDVVGVLAVDALEALGDHQPHTGRTFGHHAVFARTALAVAFAADDHLDGRGAQRVAGDRQLAAGLEAGVRMAAERGVEVHHRRQRDDLVGRDIVAQRPCSLERQRLAAQLGAYGVGIGVQEEKARRKPHRGWRHCNSMPALFTSLAYLSFSVRK
jgi:hypothetical protein